MPFDGIKIFGSTLRSVRTTMGWGTQRSSVTLSLVEDTAGGDLFAPPAIGTPALIEVYDFSFYGILQSYRKLESVEGYPTYEAIVTDPRDILENCEIIVSNYFGSVLSMPNLLNVFGYWENLLGFGGSQSNETGMPWELILEAITDMTLLSPGSSVYGSALQFRGFNYSVDLTQLPIPPVYYRVGGSANISLMQLVSQICADGGFDYFIDMYDGPSFPIIRVRTSSRKTAPPLGTITSLINSHKGTGKFVRGSSGLELRNEITSAFMIGGEVRTIHEVTSTGDIYQYFGKDIGGNSIVGTTVALTTPTNLALNNIPAAGPQTYIYKVSAFDVTGETLASNSLTVPGVVASANLSVTNYIEIDWDAVPNAIGYHIYVSIDGGVTFKRLSSVGTPLYRHVDPVANIVRDIDPSGTNTTGGYFAMTASINSREVFDILASNTYSTTVFEMLLAMSDENTWRDYITILKPAVAALLGLEGPHLTGGNAAVVLQKQLPGDWINQNAVDAGNTLKTSIAEWKTKRLHNLITKVAEEFLGKAFLVEVPFVLQATDPDSGIVRYSYNPVESGYIDAGTAPLGITANALRFQTQDGQYVPIIRYPFSNEYDYSRLQSDDIVIEVSNAVYTKANIEEEIIFLNPTTPTVLVRVSNPPYALATDATGLGFAFVAAMMQGSYELMARLSQRMGGGNLAPFVGTLPITPSGIAVPLKSNILTYGPWLAIGNAGKVSFTVDSSMVPWNYSDDTLMDLVGNAKVVDAVANAQIIEAGEMELADTPGFSLGDIMQVGGPNITGIEISYDPQGGIRTIYRFSTFTERIGSFAKTNIERLRKLGQQTTDLRRSAQQAFNRLALPTSVIANVMTVKQAMALGQMPDQARRASPHPYLVGMTVTDGEDPTLRRYEISSMTGTELEKAICAHDNSLYVDVAAMSMIGLFRPFNTSPGATNMSTYVTPNANYNFGMTIDDMNPFQSGNDVNIYIWDNEYPDTFQAYAEDGPTDQARVFALRGPLLVTGWGWSVDDYAVPNSDESGFTGGYLSGYLRKSHKWKTGAVDLLWDNERGIWTPHGMCMGTLNSVLNSNGGYATITLYQNAATSISGRAKQRTVNNFWSSAIPAGTKIMAAWIPEANSWWVIAADC